MRRYDLKWQEVKTRHLGREGIHNYATVLNLVYVLLYTLFSATHNYHKVT
jgi:hypothetical protein